MNNPPAIPADNAPPQWAVEAAKEVIFLGKPDNYEVSTSQIRRKAAIIAAHAPVAAPYQWIRPEFIARMEAELKANQHKGNWNEFIILSESACVWLWEHANKLSAAIKKCDAARVSEHAADIANIAMKIDECLGLEPAPIPAPAAANTPILAQEVAQGPEVARANTAESAANQPDNHRKEVVERLRKWIMDLEDTWACLRVQCDASGQMDAKEDIATLTAALALIEGSGTDKHYRFDKMADDMTALTKERDTLRAQLAEAQDDVVRWKESFTNAIEQADKDAERAEGVEALAIVRGLRAQLAAAQERAKELSARIDGYEARLANADVHRKQLEAEVKYQHDTAAENWDVIVKLRAQLTALTVERDQLLADAEILRWLHTGGGPSADGWEYGVMRVKFDQHGQQTAGEWTLSDSSDVKAMMKADAARAAQKKEQT